MNIDIAKIAKNKTDIVKQKIVEALEILEAVEVPFEGYTARRLERLAIVFMATAKITPQIPWSRCSAAQDGHILTSRQIITFINKNFEEELSPGGYDDIRRVDLKRPTQMGLIIKSANKPDADPNDPTRAYGLSDDFRLLCRAYKTDKWEETLQQFEIDKEYVAAITGEKAIKKIAVKVEEGIAVSLGHGPHNLIQKAVIEEFLPRFGYGAKVLYVGDTSDKSTYKLSDLMIDLGLNLEERGMLPDIVAFSEERNWLYLIEAVHSSNPLNAERCIELQRTVLKDCPYGVVYVTAFLSRKDFAKWLPQIAWETEVWLVDKPDHMIHFNGDKFIGPHK